MSKFNVGDKVRYIGEEHTGLPRFYPTVGTAGVVDRIDSNGYCWVQWPKGTTSKSDCWCCCDSDIELIEGVDMTNEEIWEMLKPKMEKNGLKKKMGALYCNNSLTNGYWVYTLDDVHNSIALAYKVGYLRAMKGRPFKIGEKKKKGGHWEPIDPNNLPKEGTRVRYSRECKDYSDSDEYICINDTGTVKLEGSWFGVELDNPHEYEWISFDKTPNCLDMWVEDDE